MKRAFLFLYITITVACSPAQAFSTPAPTPISPPTPTNTPDPFGSIIPAFSSKGIEVVVEGDGKGYLFIAGVNIPNIFFDESGQFLHIQQGEQKVQIPVEDAAGRLELKGGLLILYDETGFPQAVFDANDPDAGWTFVDPGAKDGIIAMFDEHGFDFGSLDFAFEEGVIRGYDAEGKLVFEDGKFDIRWAVLNLYNDGDNDLMPTPYKPVEGLGVISQEDFWNYFRPLYFEKADIFEAYGDAGHMVFDAVILVDPEKLAWAHVIGVMDTKTEVINLKHVMYQRSSGELVVFDAMDNITDEELFEFRKDQGLKYYLEN